MKKFLVQIVGLLVIIVVALFLFNPTDQSSKISVPFTSPDVEYKQVQINGKNIKAEIADNQSKRNKGLGGRDSLAADEGMLFVYPDPSKYPFWMKGLKFPLDFIWIKDDKVVDIIKNAPPPEAGAKDEDLPLYLPKEPVNKILEINAGMVDKLGINIGDNVVIVDIPK